MKQSFIRLTMPLWIVLFAFSLWGAVQTQAQYLVKTGESETFENKTVFIPYAFSTETLDFGIGGGAIYGPKRQPQSTLFATAYYTANESYLTMLGAYDLRAPFTQRLFLRPYFIFAHFTEMRAYVDGNPQFANERAGSNDSSEDNYITRDTHDTTLSIEMRYILPFGAAKTDAMQTYYTTDGLPSEPLDFSINPLRTARSQLLFTPYYKELSTETTDGGKTLALQGGLEIDNRDYIPSPYKGYYFRTMLSYDPDWISDARRWTSIEGEFNIYLPLFKNAGWSRQQTLALSSWYAYSPSYDVESGDNAPPYFMSPTLGGLWRLRAYPSYRFHDKSAVYYGAEYRIIPSWQPLGKIRILRPLKIRWWQVAAIFEAGRVHSSWDLNELHQNMKLDAGIGLRAMFNTTIGRLDILTGEEGVSIVAMFGQTF